MKATRFRLPDVLPVLLASLMTACGSAPTRLYTLYAVAPAAAAIHDTYAGAPIRVDAVHFPPALDHIEVVRSVAPGELRLSDVEHWSAPLGSAAKQALSADLVARLPTGKSIFPHLSKPVGALGLNVDVLDFTEDGDGVSLQASWTIAATDPAPGAAPGAATGANTGTASLRTALANSDTTAIARALSTLLGQLADRIVAGL